MTFDTIFTVRGEHITGLDPDDAVRFTAELLWAEAARLGLPSTAVSISVRIHVPDGGVDASIDVDTPPDNNILGRGRNVVQVKAGDFKPWQENRIRNELLGKGPASKDSLGHPVRDCMDEGGRYVLLCTGVDLTPHQRDNAIRFVRQAFLDCGYKNPRVDVVSHNQLIGAIKPFPSLCFALSGIGAGYFDTLRAWSMHDQMRVPFKPGKAQQEFLIGLAKEMRSSRAAVHVHLRGEAGVGKTRLALETLRAQDLAPLVVYCDGPSRIRDSELLGAILKEDSRLSLILVVDECDADTRSYLWNKFKHLGRRLKFISIYGDFENTVGETVYMDAPPLADEQIVQILSEYIPSTEGTQRWSGYCSGSPRVAHVVGLNLKRNPDDLLNSPDTVPIWDRYIVGGDRDDSIAVQQRRVVLRRLALFKRFGSGPAVNHEANAIAALVNRDDPSITIAVFEDIIHELKGRRILQGENTLYITPRLLHIKLWVDWWDRHGSSFILDDFANAVPARLLDWFFEMARYAEQSRSAQKVFSSLLDENGPFQQSGLLNDPRGARFFFYLTEASPHAALRCLRGTVGTWNKEELLNFTTGRREIVWALEKIAIWRQLFPEAARLLLRLAEAENEEHIGNNATGVFADLFTPGYGAIAPTEASPEERFPVLREALEHSSKECRRIALLACGRALQTDHFSRTVGAEHQGLRRQPELWVPKTWGELFDAYRGVWRLLEERLEHQPAGERTATVDVMLENARGLAAMVNLTAMVTDTLRALGDKPYVDKTKVIQVVELALHYDANDYEAERREPWEQLRQALVTHDFPSRMRRWVGMDLHQDKYDDSGQQTDKARLHTESLAEEAVHKPDLLRPELAWLTTSAAKNGFSFGYALGFRDKRSFFLPELLNAQRTAGPDGSVTFLSGYFRALREHNEDSWETQLELSSTDPVLRSHVPELTWRSGLTDRAAKRILSLAHEGHIPVHAFRRFPYVGVVRELLPKRLEEWIDFLLTADSQAAAVCALELCYRYHLLHEPKLPLPRDMVFRILTAPPLFTPDVDRENATGEDFEWTELASSFVEQHPDRSVELAMVMLAHFRENGTIVGAFRSPTNGVLETILRRFPAELWDRIAGYLGSPIDSRAFYMYRWLNDGALAHVLPELVWKWVDEDVEKRACDVATFVPKAFPGDPAAVSAREVLVRYGSRSDVRGSLMANFSSETWWGPESSHAQGKLGQLRSWRKDETDANVSLWLEEYIESVEQRIERAKIEEERED